MLAWTQHGSLNLRGALEAADDGVVQPPSGSPGIHVGDLDASIVNNGSTWTAQVTIHVHDENHAAVNNVAVTGQWGNGGTSNCTITTGGQCLMESSPMAKKNGTVDFSILSVTASGSDYLPGENHDSDGDSDGTSILVAK